MRHPALGHAASIFTTFLAGNSAGLDVGLGEAPETPNPAYPYLVVSPLGPFFIEGGLNDVNAQQSLEYQVTSIGLTLEQASAGLDIARDRILGTTRPDFTALVYKLTGAIHMVPGPAFEAERSDLPPVFLSNETYRLKIVPV